jgi:TRAP-type C4-dicarboxylate transport system permease small subunit
MLSNTIKKTIKLLQGVSKATMYFAMVCLFLLMIVVFTEVILRYVFGKPTGFTDEIGAHMLVLVIYCGLAYTLMEQRHIGVEMVTSNLPSKKREMLTLVTSLFSSLLTVIILWKSIVHVEILYRDGVKTMGILQTPIWIPYLVIPIGMLTLLSQQLAEILKTYSYFKRDVN